jgi:hypothetical protein
MIICTREQPWDGTAAPLVLHPDAEWRETERVCPNCGFRWTPDPNEPPDMVP